MPKHAHTREEIILDIDATPEELAKTILRPRDDTPSRTKRTAKAKKKVPA